MPVIGMITVFSVPVILLFQVCGVACLRDRIKKMRLGSLRILDPHASRAKAYFLNLRTIDFLQCLRHATYTCATVHAINSQSQRIHDIPPTPIICADWS